MSSAPRTFDIVSPETLRAAVNDRPTREFQRLDEGRYALVCEDIGTEIEVDRLHRDRNELMGELVVRCALPGAQTHDGTLSIASFNLSSARARTERAKILAARSKAKDVDWEGLLEEFVQRVMSAERQGQPAVDLRTLPEPSRDDLVVDGFRLPRRHPAIVFGDGGTLKSYTGLRLGGRLAQQGLKIAYFDWELSGEDHRYRHRMLFGNDMPRITYVRCERPLTAEADRLRRIAKEERLDYAVFDSIAFACDGPPEAAEVAGRYFRRLREIGIGSLHIAHVSKALESDKRPFGSAFWHNGARSTWFCEASERAGEENQIDLGFFNRKANLGPLQGPLGFTVTFTEEQTLYRRSSVADSPDLATKLTVTQKVAHLLKRSGSMTISDIAEELEVPVNTVTQTVHRHHKKGRIFIVLEDKKVGLRYDS